MDSSGTVKGGPYSEGTSPGAGQFGTVRITDDGGDSVRVELAGRTRAEGNAGTGPPPLTGSRIPRHGGEVRPRPRGAAAMSVLQRREPAREGTDGTRVT